MFLKTNSKYYVLRHKAKLVLVPERLPLLPLPFDILTPIRRVPPFYFF